MTPAAWPALPSRSVMVPSALREVASDPLEPARAAFIQSAIARPRTPLAGSARRLPLLAPLLEVEPAERSSPSTRSAWAPDCDEEGPAAAEVQLTQVSMMPRFSPLAAAWLT